MTDTMTRLDHTRFLFDMAGVAQRQSPRFPPLATRVRFLLPAVAFFSIPSGPVAIAILSCIATIVMQKVAQDGGRGSINSLPADALRQVFSFVDDISELEKLKLVCKRWWSCVPHTPAHLTLTSSLQVSPVLVRRYPCLQS